MAVKVTGPGVADMKKLAADLKVADPLLRKNLRKQFRDAARPVTQAAQAAILRSPSKHPGGLRAQIAATVSSSTSMARSGVNLVIVSRGARMPAGKDTLPAHFNSGKPWRHPLFGDRQHWQPQSSRATGWFDLVIAAKAPELRRAAEAAMEDVKRQIGG